MTTDYIAIIDAKEQRIMDLEDVVARKVPTNAELLECIVMARAHHLGQRDVAPSPIEQAQATALWKYLMRRES